MLSIDLRGKRALVAGVADDGGYGFAIAKALAEAGATVCTGTWPPALNIFLNLLERGKMDESRKLANGALLQFEKIYPLDAAYDTLADAPEDVRTSKRYKDVGDFSVAGLAARLVQDFGDKPIDIVVHSLANSPEVKKPLLETSRGGYLTAVGVSAYSLVSLVARLGPLTRPGGSFLSLTYLASERVVPGYGGGMSSAKAALESDTRTLAFEAGRKYGLRVNTISAGPLASRAASAIGKIEKMVDYYAANAPLTQPLTAWEVGTTAAFLASPLASGITCATIRPSAPRASARNPSGTRPASHAYTGTRPRPSAVPFPDTPPKPSSYPASRARRSIRRSRAPKGYATARPASGPSRRIRASRDRASSSAAGASASHVSRRCVAPCEANSRPRMRQRSTSFQSRCTSRCHV